MQGFPPAVDADPGGRRLRPYWKARVEQHLHDTYAGVSLCKFPEDLRVYEHLLWQLAPDTVIELGTHAGGSALWFRDRMRALQHYGRIDRAPHVVTVDIDQKLARENLAAADPAHAAEITLLEADVCDPELPDRVAGLLREDARCFVVEDSAHVYATTRAALEGFARFVPPGGFFVDEDGCVDVRGMRADRKWPHGVLPALREWLGTPGGGSFTVRRDLELYGISCHPQGYLQRDSAATTRSTSAA